MLLRHWIVRKSISEIKIWLQISFVREAKYDTHPSSVLHTSCTTAEERAQRKLWVEVLFFQTRQLILPCRDLRLRVENQQENKNRKREKLVSPPLLTLLKAFSFKVDSVACPVATQSSGPRWAAREQLLAWSAGQQTASINNTIGPVSPQHNPGLTLTRKHNMNYFRTKCEHNLLLPSTLAYECLSSRSILNVFRK